MQNETRFALFVLRQDAKLSLWVMLNHNFANDLLYRYLLNHDWQNADQVYDDKSNKYSIICRTRADTINKNTNYNEKKSILRLVTY